MKTNGKSMFLYSAYLEQMWRGPTEPEDLVDSENMKCKNILWIRMDRNLEGI